MMRHQRFTKPIPGLEAKDPPDMHVFVDCESNWSQVNGQTTTMRHSLRFGIAKCCRWKDGAFEVIDNIVFKTAKQFWKWLKGLPGKKTTWVWAHNISFDGTMLGLWSKLMSPDCSLNHFTDCNLPAFFQCNLGDRSYQFLDSLNIFKTSLSSIGKELGLPKLEMPSQEAPLDDWIPYCQRDVDILALIVEKWITFISLHGLGRMSPSLAGQALTAFRTRFMSHYIYIHNSKPGIKLERDGYYGGLVEPRFIGKVPDSPVYEYDVNSLYPYVMRKYDYPVLLMGLTHWPDKKRLKELVKDHYVIAYCNINTTSKVFPFRDKGRLYFPLGNYWTVLHKPELERALTLGCVTDVALIGHYDAKPIFREYVEFFYGLKDKYASTGNNTFYWICKYFLNALYGKFGQKRPKWEKYTQELLSHVEYKAGMMPGQLDVIKEHIEQQLTFDLKFTHPFDGKQYAARTILGQPQLAVGDEESVYSFPAIAGAVTAYAREYVRNIQEIIPRHCLFYTDTDSFFVNRKGRASLESANMLDDHKLGKLKAKTTSQHMTIYGPKDYINDTEVKRKGIRGKAVPLGENVFSQEQWPGFKTLCKHQFPKFVDVMTIKKKLKRELLTMQVRPDGWTYPLFLQLSNYVKQYDER